MDLVYLAQYQRKIEDMIEDGDETSILHIDHLLKYFPKSIDLLHAKGTFQLNHQNHDGATDTFTRILNIIPDDMVSHLGMSVIREESGDLDAAIWHMERAYEASAANEKIQRQLQALYGKRDGVQNARVRLTSGSLVRVYVRGEFYTQAINEIQSILLREPERVDLEVWLAKIYHMLGDDVIAIDISDKLISRYPDLLGAIEILVDLLPNTSRSEEMPIFINKLRNLTPYYGYSLGEEAILVPRLGDTVNNSVIFTEDQPLQEEQFEDGEISQLSDDSVDLSLESENIGAKDPVSLDILATEIQAENPERLSDIEGSNGLPTWLVESMDDQSGEVIAKAPQFNFSKPSKAKNADSWLEIDENVKRDEPIVVPKPLFNNLHIEAFPLSKREIADSNEIKDEGFTLSLLNLEQSKGDIPIDSLIQNQEIDHLLEAQSELNRENYDGALLHFRIALEKDADALMLSALLKEHINKFPNPAEIWSLLGDTYIKLNDYPSAMEAYNRAEN